MKTYHIYGRTAYADPLTLIEEITGDDEASVRQTILEKHSKTSWVELVAIPDDKIIWARKSEADA